MEMRGKNEYNQHDMEKKYGFIEDADDVLERLGGNPALLDRLLVKFRDSYRNFRADLLPQFTSKAAGDREEAYRMVHSMKGVSSNLGITRLWRRAIALEAKMKEGVYDDTGPELVSFLAELDAVIEDLG